MIIVVGSLWWRAAPSAGPAGRACGIALAAAGRGGRVELVGRVGEDPTGEALMLALAKAGVGHAAVLRDPVRPTPVVTEPSLATEARDAEDEAALFADPDDRSQSSVPAASAARPRLDGADVDLAVRYLEPSGVVVVTDDVAADALAAAVEAARYAGTRLVVLLAHDGIVRRAGPAGLPDDATVLAVPPADGDESDVVASLVGVYAAELDAGADPAAAFASAEQATAWEAVAAD